MRFQLVPTLIVVTLMTTTACNKSVNPMLQAPPETLTPITIEAGETKTIAEPKVNILFVVDNSGSMKDHQDKLKANIDVFADKFFNNPRIDYKIGVVPVYDRVYPKAEYLKDPKKRARELARKMNPLGELVPLKDKNGQVINSAPYITRDTPDAKNVLKNTVAIGVQWGPEAEESFSPVLEVISNTALNSTKNAGFYDKDAFLVVIFLTDAEDATPGVTADDFYDSLLLEKNPGKSKENWDRSKVLIAAALPSAKRNTDNCRLDGNGPHGKFQELITISGALKADLCSNSFGSQLADFGDRLVQQVGTQLVALNFIPEKTSMKLTYGIRDMKEEERQVIPRGDNGYTYDPERREITISSKLKVKRVEGGEVFIHVTPVTNNSIRTGRAKSDLVPVKTAAPTPAAAAPAKAKK